MAGVQEELRLPWNLKTEDPNQQREVRGTFWKKEQGVHSAGSQESTEV